MEKDLDKMVSESVSDNDKSPYSPCDIGKSSGNSLPNTPLFEVKKSVPDAMTPSPEKMECDDQLDLKEAVHVQSLQEFDDKMTITGEEKYSLTNCDSDLHKDIPGTGDDESSKLPPSNCSMVGINDGDNDVKAFLNDINEDSMESHASNCKEMDDSNPGSFLSKLNKKCNFPNDTGTENSSLNLNEVSISFKDTQDDVLNSDNSNSSECSLNWASTNGTNSPKLEEESMDSTQPEQLLQEQQTEVNQTKDDSGCDQVRTRKSTVFNKKYKAHDYDFDALMEAVQDVAARGMKMRRAAKERGVPYYRVYAFIKEMTAESFADDEEFDYEDDSSDPSPSQFAEVNFPSLSLSPQPSKSEDSQSLQFSDSSQDKNLILEKTETGKKSLASLSGRSSSNGSQSPHNDVSLLPNISEDLDTREILSEKKSSSEKQRAPTNMLGDCTNFSAAMPTAPKSVGSSPMINIPAGIVKELLLDSGDASKKSLTNGIAPTEDTMHRQPSKNSSDSGAVLPALKEKAVTKSSTTPPPSENVSSNSPILNPLCESDLPALSAAVPVAVPVNIDSDKIPENTQLTELSPMKPPTIGEMEDKENNNKKSDLNGLKRSITSESDSSDNKKIKLSDDKVLTEASQKKDNNLAIEEEVKRLKSVTSKMHKLKRKDLESLILELFLAKILHDHELGKYKTLCEKLETNLEASRKKTAQFHKEIEDLRKVTKRLKEEHQMRKDQLVTPIKIKRSVGIQAAPHIIQKGLAAATPTNILSGTPTSKQNNKAIPITANTALQSPLSSSSESTSSTQVTSFITPSTVSILNSSRQQVPMSSVQQVMQGSAGTVQAGITANGQMVLLNTSQTNGPINGSRTPISSTVRHPFQSTTSPVSSMGGKRQAPFLITSPGGGQRTVVNQGSAVIDLTDEEENRNNGLPVGKLASNVLKVNSPATSFVTIPQTQTVGATQYVLMPTSSTNGTPTAVMVANVASTVPGLHNSIMAPSTQAPARLLVPALSTTGMKANSVVSVGGMPSNNLMTPNTLHPAPLPRTAPQQVVGGAKQLPPSPTLKLSHKDNSIVLSWTMNKTPETEAIASYQLYAYQESSQPPTSALWKKVGSVKALELPMACTLTQFMPGHRYHFAVRAVDAKSRLGPFSEPRSINLEK